MRSTSVETSRECSITGCKLSSTGLPIGFGHRTGSLSATPLPPKKEAAESLSLPAAKTAVRLPTSRKNWRRPLSASPLKLESHAKLRRKRRSPRRQFIKRPVFRSAVILRNIAGLRQCRQRRTVQRHAIREVRASGKRQIDESTVIRVRVQIACIRNVEQISRQSNLVPLANVEILGNAHIPVGVIRLATGIVRHQERLPATELYRRAIVRSEALVARTVAVNVDCNVRRVREPAMRDEVRAPGKAQGQVDDTACLELVHDVQPGPPVIQIQIDRILR